MAGRGLYVLGWPLAFTASLCVRITVATHWLPWPVARILRPGPVPPPASCIPHPAPCVCCSAAFCCSGKANCLFLNALPFPFGFLRHSQISSLPLSLSLYLPLCAIPMNYELHFFLWVFGSTWPCRSVKLFNTRFSRSLTFDCV